MENSLPLDRLWLRSARLRLSRWLLDEIVLAPLEPILHPSRTRLQWLGAFTVLGHPAYVWLWGHVVTQPFESLPLRIFNACLGIPLLLPLVNRDPSSRLARWSYSLICWWQLPFFFGWMYWSNGGNPVWLASVACMIVIYYHLTDWRLATAGTFTGLLLGYLLSSPPPPPIPDTALGLDHLVVMGFAWSSSILLGASSANLRRTRLINTLSTMGVMAHELRTPLATINLMGDVLRNLAQPDLPEPKRRKLEDLSGRLQNLVRAMNRQIDTQISNAQLLRLPRERTQIQAGQLVQDVVDAYPFRSTRERDCLQIQVLQDFRFTASQPLFAQMLSNLIKNALHSLASAGTAPQPGDLRLLVGLHEGRGRITVADNGIGIPHNRLTRIFEPFFSTQPGAGSGLGLTFCKNVVETVNGQISVRSEPDVGASFMIDLPIDPAEPDRPAPP